ANATTTNLNIVSTISGAGLATCNPTSGKLMYDSATGQFSCGVDAGAGGGITALGPLGQAQFGPSIVLATSTSGSDFTITASGNTITYNIPTASSAARGLLSSSDWTTFDNKISSTSLSGGTAITYNSSTGVIAFLAPASSALSIPYASTTAISGTISQFTTASSTNLNISGISNSLLKTVNGVVTAAVAGTDYLTSATTFAYPFPSDATSTLL